MSLIEISSDGDGPSFHSASSGSIEVLDGDMDAPALPAAAGGARAAGATNTNTNNELTSGARRSTRVRVPAVVHSPPAPQPRATAAAARRNRSGGEEEHAHEPRVKRQSVEEARRGGAAAANDDEGGAGPSSRAAAPDINEDVNDLENLAAQIDRYNLEAAHALAKIQARQRPSALEMDRMVRAVMRLLLFRSGRSPGAPVKSEHVSAAVRGASMGAASASATTTAAGGGARASAAAAAAAAAAASAAPSYQRVAAVIKEAQARFARTLALEMAQIDLLPASAAGKARAATDDAANRRRASGAGGGGGAGPSPASSSSNTTRAYVLRSLLPPKFMLAARGRADPGNPRRNAPAVALVATAFVRLDRGGAGTPAADLWEVLSQLGLPKPPNASSALNSNRAPPNVPGIGNPADAISAALHSRLLVEKRNERDQQGQPQTVYALGEAAMGADGKCSGIDEFITAMFETADPAQAIEAL